MKMFLADLFNGASASFQKEMDPLMVWYSVFKQRLQESKDMDLGKKNSEFFHAKAPAWTKTQLADEIRVETKKKVEISIFEGPNLSIDICSSCVTKFINKSEVVFSFQVSLNET